MKITRSSITRSPIHLGTPSPGQHDRHLIGQDAVRVLVLGWCIWLLGAWGVSLLIDSVVPAARWMVFSALLGLIAIWPALRLSQNFGAYEARGMEVLARVFMDWLCLVMVLQAVVWPLRLSVHWTAHQTAWIDGAMLAWSLLTGLIIAGGGQWHSALGRSLAMALCMLLLLGGPVVFIFAGPAVEPNQFWTGCIRPIATLWGLTAPAGKFAVEPWASHVLAAALLASLGWICLVVVVVFRGRRDRRR